MCDTGGSPGLINVKVFRYVKSCSLVQCYKRRCSSAKIHDVTYLKTVISILQLVMRSLCPAFHSGLHISTANKIIDDKWSMKLSQRREIRRSSSIKPFRCRIAFSVLRWLHEPMAQSRRYQQGLSEKLKQRLALRPGVRWVGRLHNVSRLTEGGITEAKHFQQRPCFMIRKLPTFTLSQWCWWGLQFYRVWCLVLWYKGIRVSEELAGHIIRVGHKEFL